MSNPKKEAGERKLTAYERWELPHLENKNPTTNSGPAILVQRNAVVTAEEVDEESLVYEPLTASQLEEIRSAAYEEGFIQGEEEGHKKGYTDGFSKGEVDGFEKGHEEGRLIGLEEGHAEAKEQARQQLEKVETLLSNAVQEITQPLEESRAAVEQILYQSMAKIIENVCLSKMKEEGRDILKEQLSKVFEEIGEYQGRVKLRLNPEDIDVLDALGIKDRLTIQVEADEAMINGGFVVDSKSFHVDGRVEQRLEAVFNELRQLPLADQE